MQILIHWRSNNNNNNNNNKLSLIEKNLNQNSLKMEYQLKILSISKINIQKN